ncbi:Nucleosomal histone H3-Lys79 methylase [Ceratocystis pirilliformis]|uniref:Histone-lysine N-methyltransferase, H3 lysine-79 specific n=1 Tax=Ceratocystis pirilliformis TaxID=259994 RepID=A0ABR3YVV3_9PEZI
MSLFRGKTKFKTDPPKIRIERVTVERPKSAKSVAPSASATSRPGGSVNGVATPFAARKKQLTCTASSSSTPLYTPSSSVSPRSSPNPSTSSRLPSRASSSSAAATPSSTSASAPTSTPLALSRRPRIASPLASESSDDHRLRKRKAGSAQPRSPFRVMFDSSSESEDDGNWLDAIGMSNRKKRARMAVEDDPNRVIIERGAYDDLARQKGKLPLIHAADLASLALKCTPVLGAKSDQVCIELQYPSLYPRERYELVRGKDKIDAVSSIIDVVQHVADNYLTCEQARPFIDGHNGIVRRLTKASNQKVQDLVLFKDALTEYNKRLRALVRDGTIIKNLEAKHGLPSDFVSFILTQVYDRTVAPRVELLSKYENGSDNVYGELLAPFITEILVEKLRMKSNQVFVDLGSGVGNVVIQAALEIGCESWGCEMMENACNLGDAQVREFKARCRLWGLSAGRVRLERGDFRRNARILDALKRADVILVNNQAFTSQLNDDLVRMFLDLKSGCKIISLKTFVHDHKSSHNINDVGSTILDVEDHTYPSGYVSWTNAGGSFCISTKR